MTTLLFCCSVYVRDVEKVGGLPVVAWLKQDYPSALTNHQVHSLLRVLLDEPSLIHRELVYTGEFSLGVPSPMFVLRSRSVDSACRSLKSRSCGSKVIACSERLT